METYKAKTGVLRTVAMGAAATDTRLCGSSPTRCRLEFHVNMFGSAAAGATVGSVQNYCINPDGPAGANGIGLPLMEYWQHDQAAWAVGTNTNATSVTPAVHQKTPVVLTKELHGDLVNRTWFGRGTSIFAGGFVEVIEVFEVEKPAPSKTTELIDSDYHGEPRPKHRHMAQGGGAGG